jgi:hypothetical protein
MSDPGRRSSIVSEMANRPWIPNAERIMIFVTVLCVLAMLAVIGMHIGAVPGCKATHVCA